MSKSAVDHIDVRWRVTGTQAWSAPRSYPPTSEIAVDGLERDKAYDFEARNVSACGAMSVWVPSNYTVPTPPPPNAPRVPDASGVADGIALDWGGDAAPAASTMFELQRAPATGSYTVTPPPESDASWTRVGIVSGTAWTDNVSSTAAYWYRLRTIDFAGNTGVWVVLGAPKSASISTSELSAQTQTSFNNLQNDLDATTAQVQVLQGQVGDILQADQWDSTKSYPLGDLVQDTGKLYRATQAVPAGTALTDTSYWEFIGNYSSLGEAVGANAAGLATLENTVSQQGDTLTAQSQSISANTAAIGTKASATDLQSTQATVTQQGNDIAANTTSIGNLQSTANGLQSQITSEQSARVSGDQANAQAISVVSAQTATGGNLVKKGTFTDGKQGTWNQPVIAVPASAYGFSYMMRYTDAATSAGNASQSDGNFPCAAGEQFDCSCYVWNLPGANGTLYLVFTLADGTRSFVPGPNLPANFGPGNVPPVRVTAPAQSVAAQPMFLVNVTGTDYGLVGTVRVERVTTAALQNASVATQAKATADAVTGKVNASYTLRVEANGYVSGYTFQNDGSQANFNVQADNFVMAPAAGGAAGVYLNSTGFSMFDGTNAFMGGPGFGADADKMLLYRGPNAASNAASIANANFAITSGGKLKLGGAWSNFTAGWSSGASISYTAAAGSPASATISVTAGTFKSSGYPINYNASSVTVSGSGGTTVTYYLYYADAAMTGGAKALGASTNSNVAFDDPNNVFIDKVSITFPTSGSGGGPIGGGGDCVCADMWLRPGLTARDLARCWRWWKPWLWLLKGQDGWHFVRRRPRIVREPCVRVTVADGTWIDCSTSTPVTVQTGESVLAPMLLGQLMCTDSGWQRVTDVAALDGLRDVVRICVGGHSYFAGADPYQRLSTHNVWKK